MSAALNAGPMQQGPDINKGWIITIVAYFVAIALGVWVGVWGGEVSNSVAAFLSTVFIKLFKFISIPIISVSIISTLASLSESQDSGRIFKHTIFYTLLTTLLAAGLAAILYVLFSPANVAMPAETAPAVAGLAKHSYLEYVQSVIPDNFLTPFQTANVLSVLLISLAVGIAISKLPQNSKPKEVIYNFVVACQQVLFIMVKWLIVILPLGIFGFVASLAQELSSGIQLGGLATYFIVVVAANLIQMFIVLPAFLLIKGINPLKVAKGMFPALAVAFFSKSSAGTLPVTMASAGNNLRIHPEVSRFVLPICTTINMNGCAAFILITVVYLMQNAGIEITPMTLVIWVFIATIAAIGNAGVPMGCFFLSASLLASMNVPILLMGVILPFYAVVDMIETTLNVWSDSNVATAVNKDLFNQAP